MVGLTTLWLPIVLSAVIVFIASSVIHMVLTYHRADYTKLPDEDRVADALRAAGAPPGAYMFPYCATPADMKAPEMMEKFKRGPVGILTVLPSGPPAMGKNLVQWFVFCLVIGIFAAYLAGRTLGAGAEYLAVFRVAGATAFLGYGGASVVESIWMGRPWSNSLKNVFDALVYGLLTAGVFGWLWPR
jgi:hypothetical protein